MIDAILPQIGWTIIGLSMVVGLYLIITGFKRSDDNNESKENRNQRVEQKKEQAVKIHDNLMLQDKELWLALEKVQFERLTNAINGLINEIRQDRDERRNNRTDS